MKPAKFLYLAIATLSLLAPSAQADMRNSPFPPYLDRRFDQAEDRLDDLEGDDAEGAAISKKYAKAVYDVAVDGGSSTSHDLGVTLPAGAIITALHVYINTKFVDSGTGSVAIQCAGTGDLMGYRDLTAYEQDSLLSRLLQAVAFEGTSIISEGVANPAVLASTYGASVPTACSVTAVVRSTAGHVAQTAGKLTAIIEYFNRE